MKKCEVCGILLMSESDAALCGEHGGPLVNCPQCRTGCTWWDENHKCTKCGRDNSPEVAVQGRGSPPATAEEWAKCQTFLNTGRGTADDGTPVRALTPSERRILREPTATETLDEIEDSLWNELKSLDAGVRWWNPFTWKPRYRNRLRWTWRSVAIRVLEQREQAQRGFRIQADTPHDSIQPVNKLYPIGHHRHGYIFERISTTPAPEGWWDVTVEFSAKFAIRCQYAGRPIVLPRGTL